MAARDLPQTLTGMRDAFGPDADRAAALVQRFSGQAVRAGFAPIVTPILESLDVFSRVGEGTDVVTKEMYVFTDRDGSEVALRPETTAQVARAYLQHHPIPPWKVWYHSAHFRHEKPQKGRLRQHHQVGAEVIGPADADVDAEVIVLLWDFLADLGLREVRLEVNSIGDASTRTAYAELLRGFLAARAGDLDPVDAAKIDSHPLRVLDSKSPRTIAALDGHPTLSELLTADATAHFDRVRQGLDAAAVPYVVNERLVRGLDYYTHTVFEVVSTAIDASQSTIGAGGRYDGLVEAMGGAPTPGFGFGSGVERVLLACDAEGVFDVSSTPVEYFVVGFGGDATDVRDLVLELRRAGFSADRAYDQKSPKAQMKAADRSEAPWALLLGDDERAAGAVTLRDLRGDRPQRSIARAELVQELRKP